MVPLLKRNNGLKLATFQQTGSLKSRFQNATFRPIIAVWSYPIDSFHPLHWFVVWLNMCSAGNPLRIAESVISPRTFPAITRSPIELESCSYKTAVSLQLRLKKQSNFRFTLVVRWCHEWVEVTGISNDAFGAWEKRQGSKFHIGVRCSCRSGCKQLI